MTANNYEVAIIGGGLLGSSFAWGLSQRGVKTVIFDEGDDAIRTARGNFGLVWVQGKGYGMPEYARWSLQSAVRWRDFSAQLADETGVSVDYQRPGGFEMCLDETHLAKRIHMMSSIRDSALGHDYEFDVLDHTELKKQLPMAGDIAGAIYCPNDGHCNPLRLLRALQTGFTQQGGHYRFNTPVQHIKPLSSGGFALLDANDNTLTQAERVIIAAGLGSKTLGADVGMDINIHPEQGQIIITEKVPPMLNHPTSVVRQTTEGGFMLGASARDVGYDLSTDTKTLQGISQECIQAFPFLEALRIQRTWAALRIMTPDGFPVYQQSTEYPGAFAFNCHSGVTLAANHAMLIPDWVMSNTLPDEYAAFLPERFSCSNH